MNVADFDYELPEGLIAQEPLATRDASRLMVLGRHTGHVEHRCFRDLADILRPGDLVVLNDTRVLPARLEGRKSSGGRVELLLLERIGGRDERPVWECLARSSHPLREGSEVELDDSLRAAIVGRDGPRFRAAFVAEDGRPLARLEALGRMPLPPYIKRHRGDARDPLDRERYQTVFAKNPGAVAAPTAGLHFTPALLEALRQREIEQTFVTLHTGLGTFAPLRTERIEDHRMHAERYEIPDEAADAIRRARERGGRVVAVGTTVVRTLETAAEPNGLVHAGSGKSDLFIHAGHAFRVVDALVTNFHLPRSTLLMLVSAFAGRQRVLAAYEEAVRAGYRFFSYGDAMVIS